MSRGILRIYYGDGHGKSAAAFGTAVLEASRKKTVVIISFLREKSEESEELYKRLEPELKFFRFEKSEESFEDLSVWEKSEEIMNLRNGFNYSKKVVATGGCDIVILDEVLELVENEIVSEKSFLEMVSSIPDGMIVICTGRKLGDSIRDSADEVYQLALEK